MANPFKAIDSLVQYSLGYLCDGVVEVLETYPIKPTELMARTGWRDTVDTQYEVSAIGAAKAHVILRWANPFRAEGLAIEMILARYARTHAPTGLKMFALSDIRCPAPG